MRFKAATVGGGCLIILLLAGWLHPDPEGIGTHEQLGLPACSFQVMTGLPCISCGMTTAFAYAVRMNWPAAVRTQPFGAALALATMIVGAAAWVSAMTGRNLWRPVRDHLNWWIVAAVAAALAAWTIKIAMTLIENSGR